MMPLRILGIVLCLSSASVIAMAGRDADEPIRGDDPALQVASRWRAQRIDELSEKLADAQSDPMHAEWRARKQWLQQWVPGQMPAAPAISSGQAQLADRLTAEPDLGDVLATAVRDQWLSEQSLERIEQAAHLQRRLRLLDSEQDRKANLVATAALAQQLDLVLSRLLDSSELGQGEPREQLRWTLAHTRYRRARALAYRELPDVLASLPIEDTDAYERQLAQAHERLSQTFDEPQAEFVLLEIRMLRRQGKRGQALEMLERFRSAIEPRWYLKKRRDLLEELQWGPPHAEAARLYTASGLEKSPYVEPGKLGALRGACDGRISHQVTETRR